MNAPTQGRVNPFIVGLRSLKRNLYPALALQAFAIALLLLYGFHDATRTALTQLAQWRDDLPMTGQLVFSGVSTALCGAVFPFLIQRIRPAYRHRALWRYLLVWCVFWVYRGIEIDLFYRGQALLFGSDGQWSTVLKKVAFDQGVYSPWWALPTTVLVYQWTGVDLKWPALRQRLKHRWVQRDILPSLVMNLGVWLPAVAVIYALPVPLQLPIQNVVLCFWSILMVFLTDPVDAPHDPTPDIAVARAP